MLAECLMESFAYVVWNDEYTETMDEQSYKRVIGIILMFYPFM